MSLKQEKIFFALYFLMNDFLLGSAVLESSKSRFSPPSPTACLLVHPLFQRPFCLLQALAVPTPRPDLALVGG